MGDFLGPGPAPLAVRIIHAKGALLAQAAARRRARRPCTQQAFNNLQQDSLICLQKRAAACRLRLPRARATLIHLCQQPGCTLGIGNCSCGYTKLCFPVNPFLKHPQEALNSTTV